MTLIDIQEQIDQTKIHVLKAMKHLEYSLQKINSIPSDFSLEDEELLETFESFTSRFSRLSDIFSKKLLRSLILKDDPSFQGGFMDNLNQAEKLGFISDAKKWWVIRSLRNKEAHEYTDEDLRNYFHTIKDFSEFVLSETKNLLKKT
jgi:hypothetical protein